MSESISQQPNATIGKRLLAIFYDCLIVFFIIIFTLIILQFLVISLIDINTVSIPNGENKELGKEIPANSVLNYFFKSLWLILSYLYFAYFWTKSGQTPGMKVWKIKAIANDSVNISWYKALKRYLFAFFGIGLITMFFNKKRLALQDILSNTHLILVKSGTTE